MLTIFPASAAQVIRCPFFKLYEEKSGVKGYFPGIQSLPQLEQKRGVKTSYADEIVSRFTVVELNTFDQKTQFTRVSLMETRLGEINVADDI